MRARVRALVSLLALFAVGPAESAFHFMLVVEVYPGHPASPNAQYVELQMYDFAQNFVSGHSVVVYDSSNMVLGTFSFGSHVANGANQATILLATTQAQTLFGVTPDLVITPVLSASGGKVCFNGSGDCVAWGSYNGPSLGVGAPFSPAGLTLGQAVQRATGGGSNPVALDPGDDTNDSAQDFASAQPTPRNNAGMTGVNPQFVLSINDVTTAEGNDGTSALVFTVTLSAPSAQNVSVDYAAADGTAGAGSDYMLASGTLSYAPGETTKTIAAQIAGDTAVEADETFTVTLQNVSNAAIGKSAGTGTIGNDDGAASSPRVFVYDRAAAEGSATGAPFRIDVSPPSGQAVTVSYATASGSAMSGSDYTAVSGTATFSAGRNAHSVVVPILADATAEGPETFYLNITSVTGATILDGQAVGTIDDAPAPADVPMYRAYNPNAFYHFFTTSLGEFNNAVAAGYRDESNPPCCTIPFRVPNLQGSGKAAIFRMYNPNNGRHYYTASGGERDVLMGLGWVYEKDEGFVYASQEPATVEVFKLYNNISGVHLYTVRPEEKDAILQQFPGIWFQHTSLGYAVP